MGDENIKQKRIRTADKQLQYLIDYMQTHKEFALCKFQGVQGKQSLNGQWKTLSNILNEMGPTKSVEQWKKVWKNQKIITRKRGRDIKTANRRTGNFTPPPPLSEKEKKILSIIGNETSEGLGFGEGFVGQQSMNSVEIEEECLEVNDHTLNTSNIDEVNIELEVPIAVTPITSASTDQNNKKKSTLHRQHVKLDEYSELIKGTNEGLMAIADALNKIGDNIGKMTEILNNFFAKQ